MSLTDLSFYMRKFLPFAILAFLFLLILFYLFKLLLLFLTPPTTITSIINPVFGKIKRPVIKDIKSRYSYQFELDTIEGKPITATEAAKVFFLKSAATRFGYREKIYLIAKTLGFNTDVVKHQLTDKEAIFEDDSQKLSVDITNFNFNYEYFMEKNPEIAQIAIAPIKGEVEKEAIDFLRKLDRYPEELAKGKTNTIFLTFNPEENKIHVSETNKGANMAEVDFYRPDIEAYPIVSASYFNSQNYVTMILYADGTAKIVKAQVQYFEKSETQIGFYPLKSGDEVWKLMQTGKGLIVSSPESSTSIKIKKMFLGYLDPDFYQEYLQPVYVFLGDENFVGYVPAVTDIYLQ